MDTAGAQTHEPPPLDARQLASDLLGSLGVEPSEFNVQAAQATATFAVVVALFKVLRAFIQHAMSGAGSQSKRIQQQQKDSEELAKQKQREKQKEAAERAAKQRMTGSNAFGGILKKKHAKERAAKEAELNRPRSAWLGKKEFICTERKANMLLKPRIRCWFADCCYRDGADHRKRYTHPGEEDWTPKVCKVCVGEVTQQAVKDTARAFTKAGGRGDFAPMGKATSFIREYSGLPKCFLEKLATVLGGFGMTGKIRREQFAFAMLAVDAVQAALNSGDVSIADLHFDGHAMPVQPRKTWVDSLEDKAAQEAERKKELKKKAKQGVPEVSEDLGVKLPDFFNTGHRKLVLEGEEGEEGKQEEEKGQGEAAANSSSSSSANNITSAGLGGTVPRPPPIGSRLPPKLRAECMAMSVEELRARVAQEERLLQRDRAVVLVREGFL